MSNISSVGKDEFQHEVLESPLPIVVDFWAEWCGPCKMLAPIMEDIAAANQKKLKVVKINIDEEPELSEQFEVMTIPTLMLFNNGILVDTKVGALPRHMLESWLKQQGVNL